MNCPKYKSLNYEKSAIVILDTGRDVECKDVAIIILLNQINS